MLRTLLCHLRIQQPLRSRTCSYGFTPVNLSDPVRLHVTPPRTLFYLYVHHRTCHSNTHTPNSIRGLSEETGSEMFRNVSLCFSTGVVSLSAIIGHSTSTRQLGVNIQRRLYSTAPIKPVTMTGSGKKLPKGPRAKQPSRTNQPTPKEDKVMPSTNQIRGLGDA